MSVSVDNLSRPYLVTYIPGATDYINAVFVDVSIISPDNLIADCRKIVLTISAYACRFTKLSLFLERDTNRRTPSL